MLGQVGRPLCSMRSVKAEGIWAELGSSSQINQIKSAKRKSRNTKKQTVLISNSCCSIVVDVSYSWRRRLDGGMRGNLNASRLFHVSRGVLLQCLYCITIRIGSYYTAGGIRKGGVAAEWCNN